MFKLPSHLWCIICWAANANTSHYSSCEYICSGKRSRLFGRSPRKHWLETLRIRTIAHSDIEDIERSTRGTKNSKWMTERCKRLTSSNFGRICKCTYRTDKVALARSYLSRKEIDAAPLRHGCKYEHVAVQKYEELQSLKNSPCGTFVSLSMPYISSTPDRVVYDNIQGMLEKLTSFYNNYFRQGLLDKFYYRRTDKYVFN